MEFENIDKPIVQHPEEILKSRLIEITNCPHYKEFLNNIDSYSDKEKLEKIFKSSFEDDLKITSKSFPKSIPNKDIEKSLESVINKISTLRKIIQDTERKNKLERSVILCDKKTFEEFKYIAMCDITKIKHDPNRKNKRIVNICGIELTFYLSSYIPYGSFQIIDPSEIQQK